MKKIIYFLHFLIFLNQSQAQQKANIALFSVKIDNQRDKIHERSIKESIQIALSNCDRHFQVRYTSEWISNSTVLSKIPQLEQEIQSILFSSSLNHPDVENFSKKAKVKYAVLSTLDYKARDKNYELFLDIYDLEYYSSKFSEIVTIPEDNISDRNIMQELIRQKLAEKSFCIIESAYEIYPWKYVGLSEDQKCNDLDTDLGTSNIYNVFPRGKSKRMRYEDFRTKFLSMYEGNIEATGDAVLNLVACDNDVITLRTFIYDQSYRRIKTVFEKIGASKQFKPLTKDLSDSINKYLNKNYNIHLTEAEEVQYKDLLDACLFPNRSSYLYKHFQEIDEKVAESPFKFKKGNYKEVVDAIIHYNKTRNLQYFDLLADNMVSKKSAGRKLSKKYPKLYNIAMALKELNNLNKYLKIVGRNPKTYANDSIRAINALTELVKYSKRLPNPVEGEKEYKLWLETKPIINLDSISNMLFRSAIVIKNCFDYYQFALDAEKKEDYTSAMIIYFDVLKNKDVNDIVNELHRLSKNNSTDKDCSSLKRTASDKIVSLLDSQKIAYWRYLSQADTLLYKKDSIGAITLYDSAFNLNHSISMFPRVQNQKLLKSFGDKYKYCGGYKTAIYYYTEANKLVKSGYNDIIEESIKKAKILDSICLFIENKPIKDTVKVKLDSILVTEKIAGPFIQRFELSVNPHVSLIGQKLNKEFSDGAMKFALNIDSSKVEASFSEMKFPLGKFIGNVDVEMNISAEFAKAIAMSYNLNKEMIDSIVIVQIGSADATKFDINKKCHFVNDKIIDNIDWAISFLPDNKDEMTKYSYNFKDLACGYFVKPNEKKDKNNKSRFLKDKAKNMMLAYLRGFRRLSFIRNKLQELGVNKSIISDPQKHVLALVHHKIGSQYRYVNTVVSIYIKKGLINEKRTIESPFGSH